MQDYEKLGAFYLGQEFDLTNGRLIDDVILYDSKDLTTHAVIVGMTGSGKTGLGITLLEEAAIDGIPALIIDPKGDMGNLMLNFPQLQAEDFRNWVGQDEATRKGMTLDEFAAEQAALWQSGLSDWNQSPERMRRLRDAAEVAIYTPGSDAGLPLTVLKSLNAPPAEVIQNLDAMRERVSAAASGLLTLLGIDADPIRSREHILISNILDRAWRAGRNLDMPALIYEIQSPPFQKIGIMDIDQIFPPEERMDLAMTLNNILASPGFSGWMQGEPLNIQRLLYTPEGKPRLAVLSIAHLTDQERMFFVTILLNELISWMRTQPGTSSLRALLYMDEVFGYLPPTANPPSKTPLLTLLKQARAFGLGLVLSTQNPVDLDYKALSNAGTWFLGRLQTERDKLRVLDGLEGASASTGMAFDRDRMEQILSGISSRIFLMNNVHEDEPILFHTRWALSYLSGPMTREQIARLMKDRKQQPAAPGANQSRSQSSSRTASPAPTPASMNAAPQELTGLPPVLSEKISQIYALVSRSVPRDAKLVYRPAILGTGRIHFVDRKSDTDLWRPFQRVVLDPKTFTAGIWQHADRLDDGFLATRPDPLPDVPFAELPQEMTKSTSYTKWRTALKNELYQSERIALQYCPKLKRYSEPGQSVGDFRVALRQSAREQRDLQLEVIHKKLKAKIDRQEEVIRNAEHRLQKEEDQAQTATMSAWVSTGTSILGAIFGRKLGSTTNITRAGTAARAHSRAAQQKADIKRAQEKLEEEVEEKEELEQQLEQELEQIRKSYEVESLEIETVPIKPRKMDIEIEPISLLWLPWQIDNAGIVEPAWDQPV